MGASMLADERLSQVRILPVEPLLWECCDCQHLAGRLPGTVKVFTCGRPQSANGQAGYASPHFTQSISLMYAKDSIAHAGAGQAPSAGKMTLTGHLLLLQHAMPIRGDDWA